MVNVANAGGVNIAELRARYAEMKALSAIKGLNSQERSQAREIVKHTNLSADEAAFKVKDGAFGAAFMRAMGAVC